MNADIRDDTL